MASWGQTLATVASSTIVAAGTAGAQWTASLDAGAANVTYEGYLSSAALALAPAAAWSSGRASVLATGAFTRFETGHSSGAADLGARWITRDDHPIRIDLVADVDASRYQSAPMAARGRVGPGAQLPIGGFTVWGAASLGLLAQGDDARPATELSGGVDRPLALGSIGASVTAHWVGAVEYADAQATARLARGPVVVTATAGARQVSGLSGRQLWAHADVVVGIISSLALTAGTGSYPRDLTLNAPGGRYVVIGLRLRARSRPHGAPLPDLLPTAPLPHPVPIPKPGRAATDSGPPAAARNLGKANPPHETNAFSGGGDVPSATLSRPAGAWTVLRVTSPQARSVEVRGDFTQWQSILADREPDGSWAIRIAPAPGVHRFEVRIDQGPWVAPAGVTRVADDFGGFVGLFVQP